MAYYTDMVEHAEWKRSPWNHRCRLCLFPLEEDERVIKGVHSSVVENYGQGGRFHVRDSNFGLIYKDQIDYFHASCYEFANFEISSDFLNVMRLNFDLPAGGKMDRLREDRLTNLLARNLGRQEWVAHLPTELWRMASSHLLRECVVITAKEQTLTPPTSRYAGVNIARNIYAHYVMFDGRFYLKGLSNKENGGGKLIFEARQKHPVQKILIADDHLGIRNVKFISDDNEPSGPTPDIPGLWWRFFYPTDITRQTERVVIETDGFKIREIKDRMLKETSSSTPHSTRHFPFDSFRWKIWNPPRLSIIHVADLDPRYDYLTYPRMRPFGCNSENMTGYSVAVTVCGFVHIHEHRQGDLDMEFYRDMDLFKVPTFWIHMPIEKGEYLTEICKFSVMSNNTKSFAGLTFTTNLGRITVFGSHSSLLGSRTEYSRIHVPPKDPSQIFFNELSVAEYERGIRLLACENPPTSVSQPIPAEVHPIGPPQELKNQAWFYSSCSMEGLAKITLCVNKNVTHTPVVGMLLEYKNGHKVCLGQIRFDWIDQTLVVGKTFRGLHIARSKVGYILLPGERYTDAHATSHVEAVSMDGPLNADLDSWLHVPWYGTLEWWFSEYCTFVRHLDQEKNQNLELVWD